MNDSGLLDEKKAQQNQCAVGNYIWNKFPEIVLLFSEFPEDITRIPLIKDVRKMRKEMCVRNNSYVHNIRVIDIDN